MPRTAIRPMAASASTTGLRMSPISAGSLPRPAGLGGARCWIPIAERRPVFESTARDFIEKAIRSDKEFLEEVHPALDADAFGRQWQIRQTRARTEVQEFEPNYEGSSIVWGPPGSRCGATGSHEFIARAGHHLAPHPCSSGRDIFEELGEGFTLIDLQAPAAIVRACRRLQRRRAFL